MSHLRHLYVILNFESGISTSHLFHFLVGFWGVFRVLSCMQRADEGRSHKWRNVGVIFAFMVGLAAVYLLASGESSPKNDRGLIT